MITRYITKLPVHLSGHLTIHESDDGYLVITTHDSGESGFANMSEFRLSPNNSDSREEIRQIVDVLSDWLYRQM